MVDDLEASIAFWTDRLGFTVAGRAEADRESMVRMATRTSPRFSFC
jgi:catechol 2,3-dioxygenase-like lactoylglutathione lyase family enzyme